MWRTRILASSALLALGAAAVPSSAPVVAANSPTFRDCSLLVEGIDPDFVQLSGVTVTPQGTLTVPPSVNSVQIEASESSDPGDSSGHVTLTVTVTAAHLPTRVVHGAAVDHVFLAVPLGGSGTGRVYTINWSATFDNGQHPCPGAITPDNTTPHPFVVSVG